MGGAIDPGARYRALMRVDEPGESGGLVTPETVTARLAAMICTEVLAGRTGCWGDRAAAPAPRHRSAVYELIVSRVFLMDTAETTTEELLAERIATCSPPGAFWWVDWDWGAPCSD